jgi:hypothetical protein
MFKTMELENGTVRQQFEVTEVAEEGWLEVPTSRLLQ